MSDTNNPNAAEKAAKIRRKPERESVLTPTFAAARQPAPDRQQTQPSGDGLLQRQCSCGQHTIGGGLCEECQQKQAAASPTALDDLSPATPPDIQTTRDSTARFNLSNVPAQTRTTANGQPIQPDLTVNAPGDQYEQEADRVAEAVMRMPDPTPPSPSTEINSFSHATVSRFPAIQLSPLSDELAQLWRDQGKGAFFARLRQVSPLTDPDFVAFSNTLSGDDLWLTQNIATYGEESNWPIHLKVEREMKGWSDSGGKGVVFDLLRTANGSEAGNMLLAGSLRRVFASGSDDLWLGQNLQQYGREANWPIHLRVEREMKGWGDSGGKGVVFDILRAANGAEAGNADLTNSVNTVFAGQPDDLWLARNLQAHGPEANWPIHLRVEREMKGWGDSGGKGAVFDILRAANGAEASNADLTNSVNTVFAGQPDDLWLARNLQAHGPEANWPILLRIELGLKPWGPGVDTVIGLIEGADATTLTALRGDTDLLDQLQNVLSNDQFARVAAILTLVVPAGVGDPAAARTEALRILTVQFANKAIARASIDNEILVVIIPRSQLLTDVPQFASLAGQQTFDGRHWETVRGVRRPTGGTSHVAIAEENLLGGDCTATYNGNPVNGLRPVGYSSATHEIAHAIHVSALESADRAIITAAFQARTATATANPNDPDQWVDGRQGCYASSNEREFFAQLSNAYLGTNTGTDAATGDPRHNGKDWVRTHEPEVFQLLERLYQGGNLSGTNPASP